MGIYDADTTVLILPVLANGKFTMDFRATSNHHESIHTIIFRLNRTPVFCSSKIIGRPLKMMTTAEQCLVNAELAQRAWRWMGAA